MTASLPTVGGDSGVWGTELNTWLTVDHNTDGTNKGTVIEYQLQNYITWDPVHADPGGSFIVPGEDHVNGR